MSGTDRAQASEEQSSRLSSTGRLTYLKKKLALRFASKTRVVFDCPFRKRAALSFNSIALRRGLVVAGMKQE